MKTIFTFIFKLLSAVCLSLFISILAQELIKYGTLSFVFIFITVFFAFFGLVKNLKFLGVLMLDLALVLLILLSKLYLTIANAG